MYFLLVLVSFFYLSACSHLKGLDSKNQLSCENADWWEVGRQDGARGLSLDHYQERTKSCVQLKDARRLTLYLNGRNTGLVDYCKSANGFEIGRTGQLYLYVCPVDVEADFIKEYRKGRRVYQLEVTNRNLNKGIESILEKLQREKSLAENERVLLKQQVNDLRYSRAQNEKTIEQLRQSQSLN